MASIFKKGKDKLVNGIVLGALLGAAIVWGAQIYTWILLTVPQSWMVLGSASLPIYVIGIGALAGYIIDRV